MASTRGSRDEPTKKPTERQGGDDPSMSPEMRELIMSFDSKDRRSKSGRLRPKNGRRRGDHDA
jgi:hypothetical protein